MITTMPDKFVRVTSRFPNGRSTVYFDLERGRGFTLEQDQCRSEVFALRMMGCYSDCVARYGDPAEAEADFTELTTMLGDRHCPLLSLPPLSGSGGRRLALTGTIAGLALGIVGASLAASWHRAGAYDPLAAHATLSPALDPSPPRRADDLLSSATPSPAPMSAMERMAREQVRRQQQPQQQQPPAPAPRPPVPAASFGLQQ